MRKALFVMIVGVFTLNIALDLDEVQAAVRVRPTPALDDAVERRDDRVSWAAKDVDTTMPPLSPRSTEPALAGIVVPLEAANRVVDGRRAWLEGRDRRGTRRGPANRRLTEQGTQALVPSG